MQHDLFGHTAAQHHDDLMLQVRPGHIVAVLGGQQQRIATGAAPRNDGHFMHRIALGQQIAQKRMTGFVIGYQIFFVFAHFCPGFLFRTGNDPFNRLLQLQLANFFQAQTGCQQSRFVDQVGQIGAGKACCLFGDHFQVYIAGQRFLAHMYLQDLLATFYIGAIHRYLTVKTARTQQSRVQNIRTVGSRQNNNAFVAVETIHFHQQLIQRLFPLIMAAAHASAALTAYGIDFIDKDDTGRIFLGLFKQIADTGSPHAHKHFHKVGPADAEERHTGLSGYRPGQQGFPCARRAIQQYPFGNFGANFIKLLRRFQEFHDLLQFLLDFVGASHIVKGHLVLFIHNHSSFALAKLHHLAAATLTLLHDKNKQTHHQQDGQQCT